MAPLPGLRWAWLAVLLVAATAAPAEPARNVIVVTADGLRWQEVLRGMDPQLAVSKEAGMSEAFLLRQKFEASGEAARREKLLPFFWSRLVREGVLLGGIRGVQVANAYRVSYPGYAEILSGRTQDDKIRGNDPIRNPSPTILEFLREHWELPRERAALFASWDVFNVIAESREGAVFVNAGYREASPPNASKRLRELSRLQFELLTPWRTVRHDYITFEMALEYLKTYQPRALYIGLGETDDWAHDRRYDRVLETAAYFDQCLQRLWETVEAMPAYRGSTLLVVTTDHGRGSTPQDWNSHGAKVMGAEKTWLLFVGPGVPDKGHGSLHRSVYHRDIVPTILDLLGIDRQAMPTADGMPIALDQVRSFTPRDE